MTVTNPDESRIRALIADRASAVRAKDPDGALAPYAREVVVYDLAPPLQHVGGEARDRDGIAAWFATWEGPLGYEVGDLAVTVRDDIAFAHGFLRIHGTKTSGARDDVWVRQTICLAHIDGAWRIVHEHLSVPFYMDGSYRAAVDLTP